MAFQIGYHSDIGIKKKTNQDGLLMKTAQTPEGQVGLFIVCDGMGGLSQGELASATVIRGMSDWFDNELPEILHSAAGNLDSEIKTRLEENIKKLNGKIISYGEASNVQLGTTITALLVIKSKYYILQIGDSRVYHLDHGLKQLTKDQTLVAREIERGNLTEEQAKNDPRRNVLLQCVGATKDIEVVVSSGELQAGTFLLCTDGFYHEISNGELLARLKPDQLTDEKEMGERVVQLVEVAKRRGETDNISVIIVKVAGEVS